MFVIRWRILDAQDKIIVDDLVDRAECIATMARWLADGNDTPSWTFEQYIIPDQRTRRED